MCVTMTDYVCTCGCVQALGNLKQKLRKYNKEFETSIDHYRQNPILSEEESQESGTWEERHNVSTCVHLW